MNNRIKTLQKRLSHWKIDALLIENPIDLFYLTGLKLSKGRLWVLPDRAQLVVDGRYFGEASQKCPCPVVLWEKGKGLEVKGRIGFDSAWTTVANLERLKKESPDAVLMEIDGPVKQQRLLKDPKEIETLREAAKITWAGIERVRSLFREGVSEQELAFEFEFFVRKSGASRLAFETIVAFGENSAYPHHRSSTARLQNNQIVLIDAGAVFDNYCADVTRVFFFGKPDPRLERMFQFVREAYNAAIRQIHIGTNIYTIDRAARDSLTQNGVESMFTHSLGHGLGLDGHEPPLIRWDGDDREMAIQSHLVIAIEPGLYQPGLGGVRYENSGVVTKDGFESFYPED
jgi:Xaa-Pro aminopeptidase